MLKDMILYSDDITIILDFVDIDEVIKSSNRYDLTATTQSHQHSSMLCNYS